jgi:hypothetical protein
MAEGKVGSMSPPSYQALAQLPLEITLKVSKNNLKTGH